MKTNEYGQAILDINDVFNAMYSGKQLTGALLENKDAVDQFNSAISLNADHIDKLELYTPPTRFDSKELFDEANQLSWFMPDDYCPNLVEMLYGMCKTPEQTERVTKELELFIQHGMFDLLHYLKYLVDTMRQNDIVWGVGRGSSVASYVLFLLGVHKIDALKYKLDIHEFLK